MALFIAEHPSGRLREVPGALPLTNFADSMGWPLALIAFGIFMIALSALAYRIDRDYVRRGRARG